MGKSYTPTYRVEIIDMKAPGAKSTGHIGSSWDVKTKGKPTNQNLEKYVLTYGRSLHIGEVNEHISKELGYIPYPHKAKIIRQATNEVVAIWQAPMFMVW